MPTTRFRGSVCTMALGPLRHPWVRIAAQLEDDELRRDAHPWMAKRTQSHGAYATSETRSRHSPPGVFLSTTLVVPAFRSYRRQSTSKLRPQADDSYERPPPSWAP